MGDIIIPKPIAAFRSWRVDGLGRLVPLHHSGEESPWRPRLVAKAHCEGDYPMNLGGGVRQSGPVPHVGGFCRCGLYGWLEPETVSHTPDSTVKGVFAAFGRVVVHGRGVRAEKGRVVALLDDSAKAKEVAALYELPLVPNDEALKKEAERWGELREPTEESGRVGIFPHLVMKNLMSGGLWSGGIVSGYRTPQEQQRRSRSYPGTSHHGGGMVGRFSRRRVSAKVVLAPSTVVEHFQHPGGGMRTRVKDLPDCWTIRTIEEQIDRVEVPLPGSIKTSISPGYRRIMIVIEADFSDPTIAQEELAALRGFGKPVEVSETPIV